jgi:cytochrome c553
MKFLKLAGYGLAGIAGVAVLAAGAAFAASEAMIRWPASATPAAIVAATGPDAVARGERIARLGGCHDCHGEKLEGRLFHDEKPVVRAWAPNLSRALTEQSDADFERAVRRGVAADGRALWIMPSAALSQLTDGEMADLMAYMRTFPPVGEAQPRLQIGPVGRVGVLLGKFHSEPALLKANAPRLDDLGPRHAVGRDLARFCVECHGPRLEGSEMLKAPDLTMAASYELEDFERLLHTGIAAGNRKVGLMTAVSPARFRAMTPQEISALHDYLKALAARRFAAAETKGLSKP